MKILVKAAKKPGISVSGCTIKDCIFKCDALKTTPE